MATLNLELAISTRYRIERVMYRGRCGIETGCLLRETETREVFSRTLHSWILFCFITLALTESV